ncbi:UNKNOWN [Stylonychia lemnae]|uniref:Uncharacterized protein n=1 Tax=Stylonychia lemnae TaxID=5949 RepID=A0A078B088_STYLE|nr:UNKNOWN [Stylonychia lemnae]|eukprot:CDW86822.1 UNKNOWN [Stylonychia lemnae]
MNSQNLSDGEIQYLNQYFNEADQETQQKILSEIPQLFELFMSLGLEFQSKSGKDEGVDLGELQEDIELHKGSPFIDVQRERLRKRKLMELNKKFGPGSDNHQF